MDKCCTKCGLTKPTAEFNKRNEIASGFTSHCKSCLAEWRKANYHKLVEKKKRYYQENLESIRERKRRYYEANPELGREQRRQRYLADPEKYYAYSLKQRYGITKDEYDALFAAQDGVCAICQKECLTGKRLAVDHNHQTGEVRGLLCGNCNMGIGKFKDDPEIIRSALFYLMEASPSSEELMTEGCPPKG